MKSQTKSLKDPLLHCRIAMDVCRPNLIWINGSCYRKNQTTDNDEFHEGNVGSGDVIDEYEDEVGCALEFQNNEELNECQYFIEENQNGRFFASFHVASPFLAIIIGKKGSTKKRIESETKTKITIPKQGVENEDVQVSGTSKYSVATACNRIDSIVSSARQRQGFTHFISIPMNSAKMQESFLAFKVRKDLPLPCLSHSKCILMKCNTYFYT